jgi:hypothetical protein
LDSKRLGLLINVGKLFFAKLPGDLEKALKTRSNELFAINDRFRNLASLHEHKLSITCFFERAESSGLGDVVGPQAINFGYVLMFPRSWIEIRQSWAIL